MFSEHDDNIYSSEEFFRCESNVGQFMIVDSGCPQGLLGFEEYEKLKQEYEIEIIKLKPKEKLRFGPSKSYSSESKVRVPMKIEDSEFFMDFFLVDA